MQAVVYGTPLVTLKASETWKCIQRAITVIVHSFFWLAFLLIQVIWQSGFYTYPVDNGSIQWIILKLRK